MQAAGSSLVTSSVTEATLGLILVTAMKRIRVAQERLALARWAVRQADAEEAAAWVELIAAGDELKLQCNTAESYFPDEYSMSTKTRRAA